MGSMAFERALKQQMRAHRGSAEAFGPE
eukprot:COSAG04_NODE_15067_length_545_cov_0.475336_1_plen_27_part_10